jgi:hypothetical protein
MVAVWRVLSAFSGVLYQSIEVDRPVDDTIATTIRQLADKEQARLKTTTAPFIDLFHAVYNADVKVR